MVTGSDVAFWGEQLGLVLYREQREAVRIFGLSVSGTAVFLPTHCYIKLHSFGQYPGQILVKNYWKAPVCRRISLAWKLFQNNVTMKENKIQIFYIEFKGPVKKGVSVSLTSLIFGFPMSFYISLPIFNSLGQPLEE